MAYGTKPKSRGYAMKSMVVINLLAIDKVVLQNQATLLGALVIQTLQEAQGSDSYATIGKTRDGNSYLITVTDGMGNKTFAGGESLEVICAEVDEKLIAQPVATAILGFVPPEKADVPF